MSKILLLTSTLVVMASVATAQNCYSDPTTPGFEIPVSMLMASADYGNCKKGWSCPFLDPNNVSGTWPRICPASDACIESRIDNEFCEPQGPFEPTPCRGGNYCPNASLVVRCPEGHFCPLGSTAPYKCSPFASCPEGTSNEYNMVGIFFLFLVDLAVVICVLVYRHLYKQHVQQDQDRLAKAEEMQRVNTDVEEGKTTLWGSLNQSNTGGQQRNLQPLFDFFHMAKDGASSITFRFTNLSVKIPASEVSGPSTSTTAVEQPSSPTNSGPSSPTNTTPAEAPKKEDKTLLRGVTGRFRPGTVTAIMGPSGAGKTVLLNTLLNKNSSSWKQEGELNVNHQLTISQIRHVVGFVPQDDVLHPELTVEQNLFYSSETRLPASFTPEDRATLRDEIIKVLGLEHARHVQIGDESSRGVSGGQRKRCSIGVELAACPTALFLDEPTTGLDAATALDLCNLLQRLSLGTQSTVVMVVHQPRVEIWNALDQVLLLAPGGRTVYQGAQSEAKAYFQGALGLSFEYGNPADIILDGIAMQADLAVEMWDARLQLLENGDEMPIVPVPEIVAAQAAGQDEAARSEDYEPATEAQTTGGDEAPVGVVAVSAAAAVPPLRTPRSPRSHASQSEIPTEAAVVPPPRGASFPKQVYLAIHRQLVKVNSHMLASVLDVLLGTICCVIMASAKIREEWVGLVSGPYALMAPKHKVYTLPMICMFYMLAIASAVAPGGVRTFGSGMPLYWREASNGHNKLAYFIGYSIVDLIRTLIGSLHFAVIAYLMAEPLQGFWVFWMWIAFLFVCVDSQSAVLSMWLKPDTAPVLSTIVAIFMGLMNGYANIPVIGRISYAWWCTEGIMHGETTKVNNIWDISMLEEQAPGGGWNLNQPGVDAVMLLTIYFVYRLAAFVLLVALNREKQR